MSNLFNIIRNNKCWEQIVEDPACWTASHIAPESYYKAISGYSAAEADDFSTMLCCMYERSTTPSKNIKLYHEWISLYMFGTTLTNEEMKYRQQLAKRMSE